MLTVSRRALCGATTDLGRLFLVEHGARYHVLHVLLACRPALADALASDKVAPVAVVDDFDDQELP